MLPMDPVRPLLSRDRPFTRAMARAVGVDRASLERMQRVGDVVRLLRGVYVARTAPDTPTLRAAAVALAVSREATAVDRTAAWIHGVDVTGLLPGAPRPLEVIAAGRSSHRGPGSSRQLAGQDLERIEGLRLTTPLRTALDLGRLLPPDRALGAMDRLLAGGSFTHAQLLAEIPRMAGHRGVGQLRLLAAQVDARAADLAESALRLRWHEARLPSAIPALPVPVAGRLVRLGLGVARRQFGAVLAGRVPGADLLALDGAGWRIVVLTEEQVLRGEPSVWVHHLEREFHQHLLAQLESEAG